MWRVPNIIGFTYANSISLTLSERANLRDMRLYAVRLHSFSSLDEGTNTHRPQEPENLKQKRIRKEESEMETLLEKYLLEKFTT